MNVRFTDHAAQRWTERARQGLTEDAARRDLRALIPFAQVHELRRSNRRPAEPHLVLSDFVFPLVRGREEFIAVTCIARGRSTRTTRLLRARGGRDGRRQATIYRRPRHVDWLDIYSRGLLDDVVPA